MPRIRHLFPSNVWVGLIIGSSSTRWWLCNYHVHDALLGFVPESESPSGFKVKYSSFTEASRATPWLSCSVEANLLAAEPRSIPAPSPPPKEQNPGAGQNCDRTTPFSDKDTTIGLHTTSLSGKATPFLLRSEHDTSRGGTPEGWVLLAQHLTSILSVEPQVQLVACIPSHLGPLRHI
ncbi:uncharacterized protein BT62DRAFT_1004971 [Guyanagaster necrorhizus]|uniref:Uncharacterized protein n=1 Tax=Guyanagaster necrorhizus TaxID=856835 RepID=A0A9P7VUV8_9AGAR|nr:uncharacterized protein BT62DRAFT_1004971 [Guyanagaster necrorhizus MCA 3950]KAG7447369.1 hypothetical protein BT62DRAFT_1004971 [Guyanagaster necrorhizus MCA 3950]